MRLIRTSVVALVTVALLAMAVPAAQARGLEQPQPALRSQGGDWLAYSLENVMENAMSWLTRLAGSEPPVISRTIKLTTNPPTGGHYIPLTGPCIDPLGNPRCPGI
jgi:hypothetical protein